METTIDAPAAPVTGRPLLLLRLDGLAALTAAIADHFSGGSWPLLAAPFLLPDLGMLGYLAGPRVGAVAYTLAHTHVAAALLSGVGLATGSDAEVAIAPVWVAQIGFDRALGYGLTDPTGFTATHLGAIGAERDARQTARVTASGSCHAVPAPPRPRRGWSPAPRSRCGGRRIPGAAHGRGLHSDRTSPARRPSCMAQCVSRADRPSCAVRLAFGPDPIPLRTAAAESTGAESPRANTRCAAPPAQGHPAATLGRPARP